MPRHWIRQGLTWTDVLVIIAMLASILAAAAPALQAARERSRRQTCSDNLRRLGLALGQYVDANHSTFPASSGVTRRANGRIEAVDGWSWLVLLLPYGDSHSTRSLYDRLDVRHGRPLCEPAGRAGTPHADARSVPVPWFSCPTFRAPSDVTAGPRDAAITNYKAIGATHAESLSVASTQPRPPKYNCRFSYYSDVPPHPDGACFPGDGLSGKGFTRGTSNTLFAVESIEPRLARWPVGAEAAVVGLPPDVEFEPCQRRLFIVPKGAGRVSRDGTGAEPVYWLYRTYLNWDYGKRSYDGGDGTRAGRYGPGSQHRGIVNHLFADGSVWAAEKNVDVTFYMNLIMRLSGYLEIPDEQSGEERKAVHQQGQDEQSRDPMPTEGKTQEPPLHEDDAGLERQNLESSEGN